MLRLQNPKANVCVSALGRDVQLELQRHAALPAAVFSVPNLKINEAITTSCNICYELTHEYSSVTNLRTNRDKYEELH